MSQPQVRDEQQPGRPIDTHTAAWVLQLAESLMQATEVFGSQRKARDWLVTPNRQLSGTAPIDQLAKANGAQRIGELLDGERSRIKSRNSGLDR